MYINPPLLKQGDTIGIISPATKPGDEEKFQKGITYLEKKGFNVVVAEHVLDEYGYLAGTDEARANDLNIMFRNPEIDAIICSRGGYGTPRLLHLIDYEAIKANPKDYTGKKNDIEPALIRLKHNIGINRAQGIKNLYKL